jgi:hypothetical protein
MNLTRGINLRKIAEMMPGASGAEVKVRQCVYIMLRQKQLNKNMVNFQWRGKDLSSCHIHHCFIFHMLIFVEREESQLKSRRIEQLITLSMSE